MSILRRLVDERRSINLTGLDDPRLALRASGMGGLSWAGIPVTDHTALQLATVWACVSLLSDTISSLPVGAFRKAKDDRTRIPVVPTPQWIKKPHPELDMPTWLGQGMVSLLMRGNSYGRVVETDKRTDLPSAIKPLHPDDVRPKRDRASGLITYKLRGEKEATRAWPAGEVIHIRGLTLPGGVVGLSPIEYARQAIGLGLAAEEYGARYFGESANPSGTLSTEQELSAVAAKTALQNWMKAHANRSRVPAVLSGGVKFQPLSINPDEAQFLETRAYQRVDIAQLFRVPLHMISIMDKSTSWGTGIEEQVLGLVTFTLMPWLVRWETKGTELLPEDQFVKFNLAGLLRGRLLERYQAYLMGRNGGWLSINDVLELEDMPPIDDPAGDNHLQPLNYIPLEQQQALDPNKPAPKPAPQPPPAEEPAA